ncbi:hypothetical protein RSAG8_04601, partial [Rhizoctonia solani AG-8 WAC10335]
MVKSMRLSRTGQKAPYVSKIHGNPPTFDSIT